MAKISRTVDKLSNSSQLSLFALSPNQRGQRQSVVVGEPRFNDPCPETILIAQESLGEFLTRTKQTEVFLIRDIVRALDFSSYVSQYSANGRPAYHPALMLSLLLFAFLEGRTSLRQIESFAKADLRCMWLTGGAMPDHSILGRFINKHQDLLSQDTFVKITQEILKKTKSRCNSLAGDGTIVQSAASYFKLVSEEAAQLAAEEAKKKSQRNPKDQALAKRAQQSQSVADTAKLRNENRRKNKGSKVKAVRVSPTDPEAVLQPLKNKCLRPSYKPVIMASEDRIIVAQTVEPSSETGAIPKLLNQAQALVEPCKQEIDQLLLDAGFFCFAVILLALKNDLDLLCPKGGSQKKRRDKPKYFPKSNFEYVEDLDLYNCPTGKALCRVGGLTVGPETEQFQRYQMRPEICAACPLKAQCTSSPKGRSIKRYKTDELKEALCEVMEQEGAKKAYSKRQAWVEPVFGELRGQQSFNRFRRVGHGKVKVEFSLHAMSHNLRRCLVLVGKVEHETTEGPKEAYFAILVWS